MVRLNGSDRRNQEACSVHLLQPVQEHRAVPFIADVATDNNHEVRSDTEDVLVIGSVVDLAERKSVRHDGETPRMSVRQDVRRVE